MSPARVTSAAIPEDLSSTPLAELIEACASGENAAWKEFMRRYNRVIAVTAARIARNWGKYSKDVVDDLVQDTYSKLCARKARVLREVRIDHPDAMHRFLKVVTANLANDYFKKDINPKHGGGLIVPLDDELELGVRDAGPTHLTASDRKLLLDKLVAYLRVALPPETRDRDLTIYGLYFRRGLTAREAAGLPLGLTVKGVESALHRLIELIREFLK
jgi:DNA-directed RNA polymerase specialized sigma24 family protein